VAKYIPSNMVHLAGRHILARELGYKDTVLMMANIFDMLLLLFTAMFIVIAGMLSGLIELPFFVESALSRGVYKAVALIIVFSGLAVLLWLIKFRRNKIMEYIRLNKISDLVRIVLLFLPGFILSTFILLIIFKFMLGAAVGFADAVYFFTAFTMAWTAGFVIPGAPGGIGIRETVILILFGGLYGENNTVIAALLMRLISIAGDVAVWIIATLSEKTEKKEKK
jgi:hypothetical protein